ncbi:MAG: BTAD domain-containing putative transcriptional regulator [Nitrospira sp.]|nr:BTAD domain-containing putative transcriptional regulator [Nitrospira sp.]
MARVLRSGKPSIFLAKLSQPRLPAIVERPRLYRLLDRARTRPVIWINAPPGFGKTTLVASYLRARKIRPLWYQVDEGDRDLATFFHYLSLVAKQAAPRYRRPLPHLTPEYLQGLPTFTRRFFEHLYARLKRPALLILDNYQEVPVDSLLHETVALGIEALPEKIGVVVMSRALPPPAFARLQAIRQIHSIDEQDLRLTKSETRAIVRLHMGSKKAPKPTFMTLHDKLQGWVAGLVLQLEQIKADRAQQPIGSRESPQVIFDYLAREVMQRFSPEMQRFLIQTAFLPDMTAAMATRLTGNTMAGDILAKLYQSRYFTERRAETEYLYQYHPLFREFLRARGKAILRADEVTEIQRAAASILEEAGRVEDAVTLYAEAGQIRELIQLVLARGPELLQEGRSQTLERWLAQVPTTYFEQEPWLSYWLAACRLPVAPVESEAIFEKAFELFKAHGNRAGQLLTLAGIISSIQFSWIDNSRFDRWIDIMLETVSPDASFPSKEIEIQFTFSMVTALMWRRPQSSFIAPWIDRAKHVLEEVPDVEKYSFFVAVLGSFLTWLGDIESADKYSRILKSAAESETSPPLMRVVYYANRVMVDWSRGDPEESLRLVEQGLAISKKTGVYVLDVALLSAGIYASLFRKDVISAEQYRKQSAPLVTHPAHIMRANYMYLRAWIMRVKGDLRKAWEFIKEGLEVKGLGGSPYPKALLSCAAAELLQGLGEEEQADKYLGQALSVAKDMESRLLQFMGNLFQSQFAFERGHEEAALAVLRKAFAIGRQGRFSFFPWLVPQNMAHLCARALEAKIEVDYVQDLIRKTRLVPNADALANETWPWPVKIYTLGRFEIRVDGRPLPPRRKAPYRVLNLLKAMIAFGGQDIPTSRLIDALWPDAEGDAGEETFHKTLQRLRRLLNHDGLIQVGGNRVSLNRQVCWVDALAFQTLLNGADDSMHRQAPLDAKSRRYEQAIALYRGPFLEVDGAYEWADHSRERLRHQFERSIQHVSEWKKMGGQDEAALTCLENGLEADPLAEPIYPHLIRFLLNLERLDEANHVLARYHKAVVMAGREPSVEMQHLAKNLSAS